MGYEQIVNGMDRSLTSKQTVMSERYALPGQIDKI
jgi:hypothetical protein